MLKLTVQNAEEGECCSPGPLPSAVPCASVTQRVNLGSRQRPSLLLVPAIGLATLQRPHVSATLVAGWTRRQKAGPLWCVMRHSMQWSEAVLAPLYVTSDLATHFLPSTHSWVCFVMLPTCDGPHELRMLAATNAASLIL